MKNLLITLIVICGLGFVSCGNHSKADEESSRGEEKDFMNQEQMDNLPVDSVQAVNIKPIFGENDTYGQVELFDITSNKIEFVDSVMPLDAFMCVPAAFTKESFEKFTPGLVANKYVTNGVKKQGYDCKISQSGCFAIDKDGNWYLGKTDEEKYRNAVNYFEQNLIIDNHKINPKKAISHNSSMDFRCLAEINNRLCFVQSIIPMTYDQFINWLQQINVTNAIYLDMGAWSFGYIKDGNTYYDINPIGPKNDLRHNKIRNIKPDPKQTNWIVVR